MITSVKKVDTESPNIIATPIGLQNAVFSPPITQLNVCQSKSTPVVNCYARFPESAV